MLRHINYIEIVILALPTVVGLSSYDNNIIGNYRHQTFATEKLLNVEKYPKSYIV